MRARICAGSTFLFISFCTTWAGGQASATKVMSQARFELKMELATTNDDRSPQALRFTLTNVGNQAVMLPLPSIDCIGKIGRIHVLSKIVAGKPKQGGFGHGCGGSGGGPDRSFIETIKRGWLHLAPGEFVVLTGDARSMIDKSNGLLTYEYWAEYEPPILSDEEKGAAESAGLVVPTEPVRSEHLRFSERWPPD